MAKTAEIPEHGLHKVKEHILESRIPFVLWIVRNILVLFTIGYFLPIIWSANELYFKVLLCNLIISSLRLYQRLNEIVGSEFLKRLIREDSLHYLLYCVLFFPVAPVSLVLLPVFLFSVIHSAAYSLTLLDLLGQNSWWLARIYISIIEFQAKNILRLIAATEIILMPFTVIFVIMGRASLLTPFFYYHFLRLRYMSMRNPYSRNVFHELRLCVESTANKPGMPDKIRQLLLKIVTWTCWLGPQM